MKPNKKRHFLVLGTICILYWVGDFIMNALIPHDYSWLLWYSSVGLLLTGVALLLGSTFILYSLFCALFIPEMMWVVDFFVALVFHKDLFGLIIYTNMLDFMKKDFYLTLYHFLIPSFLLYAIYKTPKVNKYGWIGALFFILALLIFTSFIVSPQDQVNCISSHTQCKTIFSFLYMFPNPERIILAIIGMTLLVYFPTNFITMKLKENSRGFLY